MSRPQRPSHGRPRVLASGLLALVVVLLGSGPVWAHGALRTSDPAAGQKLPTAPRELRLSFTEPVELAVARLEILGPSGPVSLGPLRLHPDSSTVLIAPIQGVLAAGAYTVRWQVVGSDGHPVRDEYSFVVEAGTLASAPHAIGPSAPGQPAPPAEHHTAGTPPPGTAFGVESPAYAVVRWLTFLGLVGVIGVVAFRSLILPRVVSRGGAIEPGLLGLAERGAARVGAGAAGLVALAAILRLYAQSYAIHGSEGALDPSLVGTMLARTLWGWGWTLQVVGALVALAGFAIALTARASYRQAREVEVRERTPQPAAVAADGGPLVATISTEIQAGIGRNQEARKAPAGSPYSHRATGWFVAALAALLLAFTPALSGHAAATTGLAPIAVLADGLHVLGAGGWLGSLLLVLAVGVPSALRSGGRAGGPTIATMVNAFSPVALAFAGIVVVTGFVSAALHLGSLPALWESAYGRALLLKLALLSVLFATGAYNWRRVRPALGDDAATGRLRRSAKVELAAGIAVLAVTAVLVATPPPDTSPGAPAAEAPPAPDRPAV